MHGAIGENHHAVLAEHRIREHHDESARYDADARQRLHVLESGPEHVARRIVRPGHFAVGIAGLDHQRTQIERIDDQLLGLLGGQAFRGAQLQHQIDVLRFFGLSLGSTISAPAIFSRYSSEAR